jgi:hypothetical protein
METAAYSIFNSLRGFENDYYFRVCLTGSQATALYTLTVLEFRQTTLYINFLIIIEEAVNQ